jgi:uncharacterized RDD family membrane protein YckC
MIMSVCPSCGAPNFDTQTCVNCQKPLGGESTSPPEIVQVREMELIPVVRAGFMRRFAAFAIDWLLLGIITDIFSFFYRLGMSRSSAVMSINAAMLFSTALFILYFTFLPGDGGQSLGKMVMGIRIERSDGAAMTYGRAFLRALGYFLSFFFMTFLGFWWALWDRKNQTWHDKIAGTEVIKI